MDRVRFLTTTSGATAAMAFPRLVAAQSRVTIKIGFVDSFSGTLAPVAQQHFDGATVAVNELNQGKLGYEIVRGDDAGKPQSADSETGRLAVQEKVDILLGGTSSGCALAKSAAAAKLSVLNVEVGAVNPTLTGANASRAMNISGRS